jgi:hypothetical protein
MDDSDAPGPSAELVDPTRTVAFLLAGNAVATFQSRKTGKRFTYRVRLAPVHDGDTREPLFFVSVLDGPNNDSDYAYLGCVYTPSQVYRHGRKSRIAFDAPSAVAFDWVWAQLQRGAMHPELAVYHEGRCGRCGRRLSTPESISIGLGPTCANRK